MILIYLINVFVAKNAKSKCSKENKDTVPFHKIIKFCFLSLLNRHLIPECGDLHTKCPTFTQYCQMKFVRIDGRFVTELCPYTCGQCYHLPSTSITTKTTATTVN